MSGCALVGVCGEGPVAWVGVELMGEWEREGCPFGVDTGEPV